MCNSVMDCIIAVFIVSGLGFWLWWFYKELRKEGIE